MGNGSVGTIAAPVRPLCALGMLLAGSSCASSAPPPVVREPEACAPQSVAVTLIASRKINRDDEGESRPVQIRLYQLKTDSRVLNASFDDLWKDDKATLKEDLVKVDEFPVYPGTRTEAKFDRDDTARFVVAVALFRNPKGRSWWAEFEMPAPSTKGRCATEALHFTVWIDQTRVTEGSDHLDEFPNGAHIRELYLHFDPGQPASKGEEKSSPSPGRGQSP
jgi:type VI secretion system protein VasD